MKDIWKLNRDGSLATFYRYFYKVDTLPRDGCNYFWLCLLAIILTPFVWPALVWNMRTKRITLNTSTKYIGGKEVRYTYYYIHNYGWHQTGLGAVYNFILFVVGAMFLGLLYKLPGSAAIFSIGDSIPFIFAFILIQLSGILGIAIVYYGGMYLIKWIAAIWPEKKQPQTEEEWDEYYRKEAEENKKIREREDYKEKHPNFFKLIIMRIVSFKEKRCPIIEWDETKTPKDLK